MRILPFLLLALSAHARELTLEWDPSPVEEQVQHYVLWESASPAAMPLATVTGTEAVIEVIPGTHVYFLTAHRDGISSPPSDTLTIIIPSAPAGLRVRISLNGSNDGNSFEPVSESTVSVPADKQRQFYRGNIEFLRE